MATTLAHGHAGPAAWRPDPSGLAHVVGMLRASTEGTADQESVYARLQTYATRGDFNNYLAYILARGAGGAGGVAVAAAGHAETVRQAAGLLLKNNLKALYKNLAPPVRQYINNELLSAIGDDSRLVRSAVAVCITAIVSKAGLQVWPDLFPTLVSCLDSNHDAFLDGALNALCRICEDAPDLLDEDPSQPLDVIIPKLLAFFEHPDDKVRIKVVHILNQFLLVMPPALNENIDAYLAALFRVAEDASFEVRKRVCSAICMLLETKPDALAPHMSNIVAYMVHASADSSSVVAQEACEFWSAYAVLPAAAPTLRACLPQLVPILLNNMVYSEEDRALYDAEQEEDDTLPDRPQDIRPRFHSSHFMSSVGSGQAAEGPLAPNSSPLSTSPNMVHRLSTSTTASHPNPPPIPALSPSSAAAAAVAAAAAAAPTSTPTPAPPSSSSSLSFASATKNTLVGNGPLVNGIAIAKDANAPNRDDASLLSKLHTRSGTAEAFVAPKVAQADREGGSRCVNLNGNDSRTHIVDEEDVGRDSGDEEDDDDDVAEEEWNVRKCSAASLDALACAYGPEVLSLLLPLLQDRLLNTQQWEQREAGVLALGAIADGCYDGVAPHLPTLFPYLLNSLADRHHRARVMSCWTLSRYTRWVLDGRTESTLVVVLKALSERMLDRNKTVQRAACSAFASLEEQAGRVLVPYIGGILQTVSSAFARYQQINLLALYDTLGALADAVGSELAAPDHVALLMPPLINRWNVLADDDLSLVPLLECLTTVFRALGPASEQFVLPIFTRCVNIVEATYSREANGKYDDAHVELLTGSLDLMCSLGEALGPRIDSLLVQPANSRATLLQLLYLSMKDKRPEVRQSALALVGEFARSGMPSLIPVLVDYVGVVVGALSPDYMRCANNATWALGEMIMMAGFLPSNVPLDRDAIQKPLLEKALPSLIRVVNMPQLSKSLFENTSITLGRMGLVMPEAVAPRLDSFVEAMLTGLRGIQDDADKEHAFSGVNAMIKLNPMAVLHCFALYADAISSWVQASPKLEADFGTVLVGFKSTLGNQWPLLYATCPADLQMSLKVRFSL